MEYKIVRVETHSDDTIRRAETLLNELGLDDWQIVHISSDPQRWQNIVFLAKEP